MPAPRSITIIRHAEKPNENDPKDPPFGVLPDGTENPHSLTPVGWQRAGALAALVGGPAVRTPFVRPTVLIAPQYPDRDDIHRPHQTIVPLAARVGVPIGSPVTEGHEDDLARQILLMDAHDVLVCWEHHHLPAIVAGLAPALGVTALPPNAVEWPDDDFWSALVFVNAGGVWTLVQVSQALLAGDPA